ncbi:MAG: NUDIX domain-containing protein [Prolixibacteraceae bacterium]
MALKQFAAFGGVKRDSRGRTISVVFWSQVPHQLHATSGDDAQNARWFKLSELPPLAFDHQQIIQQFIYEKKIELV